ncbi:ribonuclease domain-containing protein [Chitinimonas sp. BJB300]|uniref:ribonuclease domain-containing protein n=1 Tax=Chitinimonas sp. BJB300 TaxID=1559339 RepID=UPI000C11AFD3|nr:ribonuclease domain-containing protein [Chitinimonas sp. BJB300]PHV10813.1 ribonuclease [Chitinimonas sp. BJB300]TSJ87824.1 ribonuclease [Chitinimonas sp. BJB300]
MRFLFALLTSTSLFAASLPDCQTVVRDLNSRVQGKLNSTELVEVLSALHTSAQLPKQFVTKKTARELGWRPGRPLWATPALQGKSIGGDVFRNLEHQLPTGSWREADLNYRGGKRGAQRLVFEPRTDGRRFITTDHYNHFMEAPACR